MSVFAQLQAPPLEGRHTRYLAAYLTLRGWSAREYSRWIEFFGEPDADGEPLMLVLPQDPNVPEAKGYVAKAVSLLSALDDEPESVLALRIRNVHNDVFIVRNIETGSHSAISIRVADQQVNELRHLVALSAQAERDPCPYYENPYTANHYLEEFRFGHTVRGSFALTIEAPILRGMEVFTSNIKDGQPPLLPDLADYNSPERDEHAPVQRAPVERRIVERIMRGLIIARHATEESSIEPVVSEYGRGFSSNMCSAVVRLANNTGPIEYGVIWSPKLPVAVDLQEYPSVKLDNTSYTILREAAVEMKKRPPKEERIRGIVTHFGSDVEPLSDFEEGRVAILKWIREEGPRTAKIVVPLTREQYILAYESHLRWATVAVTGKVVRSGAGYQLVDPHDFEVLN